MIKKFCVILCALIVAPFSVGEEYYFPISARCLDSVEEGLDKWRWGGDVNLSLLPLSEAHPQFETYLGVLVVSAPSYEKAHLVGRSVLEKCAKRQRFQFPLNRLDDFLNDQKKIGAHTDCRFSPSSDIATCYSIY